MWRNFMGIFTEYNRNRNGPRFDPSGTSKGVTYCFLLHRHDMIQMISEERTKNPGDHVSMVRLIENFLEVYINFALAFDLTG